jgi:hypothetical protein
VSQNQEEVKYKKHTGAAGMKYLHRSPQRGLAKVGGGFCAMIQEYG